MDLVEATQVIRDNCAENNYEEKVEVGLLKIGSESHAIYKGFNRIGRSPICRVILSDVTVSKVHAEIQAGVKTTFISDLRSSNGTKIEDVSIKPFHYYQINDGDVIYFGHVRAEYATTIKTTESNNFAVPETPDASKNRHGSDKRNSGIGNLTEESFLTSSMYDSDVSLIPGTQETEKKQTFQKQSSTIKKFPNVSHKVSETRKLEDTPVTDIHDMETQNDVDLLCRPPAPKRLRLQKSRENAHGNETNIHEAETQAMIMSLKCKEIEQLENQDDIYEAETQVMSPKMINRRESKKIQNDNDIFDAETQAMPITKIYNKKAPQKLQIQDDIFEAETQASPMRISTKKDSKKLQIQDDIFEAETQALSMPITKQKNVKKSQNQENIHDAETQAMEISDGETSQNISEMATQIVSIPLQNNNNQLNETAESSLRSNSSRGRLRLSATPPSSPENLDDMCESQNLLEIAETPLFVYDKIETKKSPQKEQQNSKDDEEEKNVGEKKSPNRRPVQTIPESSESETDDERPITRNVRKTKPSNVIEDSSDEEATDEENVFGASAIKGNLLKKNIREKSTGTPNVEDAKKLEVKKVRSLSLHSKKNPQDSPEKVLSGDKSNLRKSINSPITIDNVNEEIETEKIVNSPTSQEKNRENVTMKKSTESLRSKLGNSPLRLARRQDENSSKIGKVAETGQVKSNLFGGSDKKNESTMKNDVDQHSKKFQASPQKNDSPMKYGEESPSKKFDTPTIIFQNGEEISIEKNDDKFINDASTSTKSKNQTDISEKSKTTQNQAISNTVRDSPKKNDKSSKSQGELSINEPASPNKSGRSSLCILRKGNNNSPTKIDKISTNSKQLEESSLRKKLSPKIREDKKIDEDCEEDIFEDATQRINPINAAISVEKKSDDKTRNLESTTSIDDDIDIDLLPTQILDVPSSTPFTRKTRTGKKIARKEFDGDDLHCAPTQITNVESLKKGNVDNDILMIDDYDEKKSVDKKKKNQNEKTIDLDDSVAINLGRLLGEEGDNRNVDDDDDATQLMTQNLVDILRPSQNFDENEPRGRKSSPRVNENITGQGTFDSPLRKRIYAPGTLGFIDGEAKDGELVSADSSPIKEVKSDGNILEADKADKEDKANKPEPSALHPDEDDIFFGLPEVKIAGTLAYPGSPVSSEASTPDVSPRSFINSSRLKNFGKIRSFSNLGSSTSKIIASSDPDSPITPKKSRITRRDAARYRIMDDAPEDSDDDFDYQDLKRMADRLLATESAYDSKPEEKKKLKNEKKIDKISISVGSSRKRKKNIESEKNVAIAKNSRTTKASCGSSSFIVSDAENESSGKTKKISSTKKGVLGGQVKSTPVSNTSDDNKSLGETRKSTRQRKPTEKAVALSKTEVITKEQQQQHNSSKESQEIEAILGSSADENLPMISRKSYVKVQLTRLDDSRDDEEQNILERPKVTRTRRTISAVKKEELSPLASPAKRVRRTIAATPGIVGNSEIDYKIMFTGVNADSYSKIVEKLGGTVVSEPSKATVLITDKVRRTYKFLCAVAQGIRVVSINWLLESNKASKFLDCDKFILQEPAAEAKYKFKLKQSLEIAKNKKFLEGYTILITPKVNQPEVHELKAMVEAGGGRLLVRPPGPRSWNAKTVIISREEDYTVAKSYLAKVPKNLKVTVQSTEFILTGILRQEVNLVEHMLDFT